MKTVYWIVVECKIENEDQKLIELPRYERWKFHTWYKCASWVMWVYLLMEEVVTEQSKLVSAGCTCNIFYVDCQ